MYIAFGTDIVSMVIYPQARNCFHFLVGIFPKHNIMLINMNILTSCSLILMPFFVCFLSLVDFAYPYKASSNKRG